MMGNSRKVALGLAAAGGIILAIALFRKGEAAPPPPDGDGVGCYTLSPGRRYYFDYNGTPKTFKNALGECWSVIYTIDVYNADEDDWLPPADPVNDILHLGSQCAIEVQAKCVLCGFAPTGSEPV